MEEIIPPPPTAPAPSTDEDDDDFDDDSDEFSLYKFSIRHFQGNASHKHIAQRLKQPLLPHDDEGDALVRGQRGKNLQGFFIYFQSSFPVSPLTFLQTCLTVWWIILRYMGDLPEPKSQDAMSQTSSTITSRQLPNRQGRRLSNLVGLDQVT